MKYFVYILFLSLSLVTTNVSATEPKALQWEDLIPDGFVAPEVAVDHSFNMTQALPDAPVVAELNGKFVKIPGFVVPLKGTSEVVNEFLLVPFFGACVHVPPPPSNQIVHVTFKDGVAIESLYDAVWITGHLSTQGWKGNIASVGYRLEGLQVDSFEFTQ